MNRIVNYRKTWSFDSYTKVLLHFDDDSDPFKDECGNSWAATGSPTLSSTAKFGKALSLNSSSSLTMNEPITLGEKNFTIDFWVYIPSTPTVNRTIFNLINPNKPTCSLIRISQEASNSAIKIYCNTSSDVTGSHFVSSYSNSNSRWLHVGLVYFGNQYSGNSTYPRSFAIYLNGTKQTMAANADWSRQQFQLVIGSYFTGFIDEFRISDGIARYDGTNNFTPPTKPYSLYPETGDYFSQEEKSVKFYDMAGAKPNIVLNGDNGSHTYAGTVPVTVAQFSTYTQSSYYWGNLLHLNDPDDPFYDEALVYVNNNWGYRWKGLGYPSLTETNAKFGKALYFNGSNQGVLTKAENNTSLNDYTINDSSFNVDFWTYIDSTGPSNGVIVKIMYAVSADVDKPILMISRENTKLLVETYPNTSSANNWYHDTVYSTSEVVNRLIHIAVSYDHSNKFIALYINGQKDAQMTLSAAIYRSMTCYPVISIGYNMTSFDNRVANNYPTGDRFFKGTISEFRLLNKVVLYKGNSFTLPKKTYTAGGLPIPYYNGLFMSNPSASSLRIHLADGSVKAIAATKQTPQLYVSSTSLTLNSVGSSSTVIIDTDSDGEIEVSTDNTDIISLSLKNGRLTVTNIKGSGTAIIFVRVTEGREFEASGVKTITVGTYNWGALDEHSPNEMQKAAKLGIAAQLWAAGDMTAPFTLNKFQTGGYYSYLGNSAYQHHATYVGGDDNYRATILGFNHNSTFEGNNSIHFFLHWAGNWFAFTDKQYGKSVSYSAKNSAHATYSFFHHKATQSNKGGWTNSIMQPMNHSNALMGLIYNALPAEWQSVIQLATKYTDNRTDRSANNIGNGVDITSTLETVFLLSEYEVFGEITYSHPDEARKQAQYDWFKYRTYRYPSGHSLEDELITQYKNAGLEYVSWWLRSPCINDNKRYCCVNASGQPSKKVADASLAIVPCFVIS